jgi:endoglucanase
VKRALLCAVATVGLVVVGARCAAAPVTAPVTAPAGKVAVEAASAPTPSYAPSPASPAPSTSSLSASTAGTNPFEGAKLYVDPQSQAALAAGLLSLSDPTAGALVSKIASQPQADWFGDWNATAQVADTVRSRIRTIEASHDLPVLVTYAIPARDCGGHSAGGLSTAAAFHDWVSQFAAGIGTSKAVVIVEPDALAKLDCLAPAARTARLAELRDAVDILTALPNTAVYLDAGHSNWQSVATMTARLEAVGTTKLRGFSLNVSGFGDTTSQLAYGEQLAEATGTHYVVDTSRNGLGTGATTCNPPGRALGDRPTAVTGAEHADAYLWIKHPGESDGMCGSGQPAAGVWSTALAKDLASRAGW